MPVKRIVAMRPGRSPAMCTRMVSPSATNVLLAFHHVQAGAPVPGTQGARHAARAGAQASAKAAQTTELDARTRARRTERLEQTMERERRLRFTLDSQCRYARLLRRRFGAAPRMSGHARMGRARRMRAPPAHNETLKAPAVRRVRPTGPGRLTVEGDLGSA